MIHDLNELRKLYNKCKVGLCISMTNPSRIPYEMMASGCVPVDIYRYNNLLDFKSGTSLLAY
ncbi:rhamnosyltransferase WsaF family glycosyltransferase, partial [Vibrio parahaemolyticus]|uniref:rhamnosyltransferase WsaF family glycosyltransferase n=1 Tax=Vibrio parahaemolyticus TaxID=670 RepID=UPI00358E299A